MKEKNLPTYLIKWKIWKPLFVYHKNHGSKFSYRSLKDGPHYWRTEDQPRWSYRLTTLSVSNATQSYFFWNPESSSMMVFKVQLMHQGWEQSRPPVLWPWCESGRLNQSWWEPGVAQNECPTELLFCELKSRREVQRQSNKSEFVMCVSM